MSFKKSLPGSMLTQAEECLQEQSGKNRFLPIVYVQAPINHV